MLNPYQIFKKQPQLILISVVIVSLLTVLIISSVNKKETAQSPVGLFKTTNDSAQTFPKKQSNSSDKPTSQSNITTSADKNLPNKISSYSQVYIGQTEDQDLINLIGFKNKQTLTDGKSEYHYQSPRADRDNIIITQANKVVFERAITIDRDLNHPLIDDYLTIYGEPEAKLSGSNYYGPFYQTFIYSSKGLAFVANPINKEIGEIHTFEPISVDSYLKKWGDDINTNQSESGF